MKSTYESIRRLALIDLPSTRHLSFQERRQGISVMLSDLERLATIDGCIAAAWALELAKTVGGMEDQS